MQLQVANRRFQPPHGGHLGRSYHSAVLPVQLHPRRTFRVISQAKDSELADVQLNYHYQIDLPEGQLSIRALQQEWLPATAELLADVFVDIKSIAPYRTYVRRNITNYLKEHIQMPPKACVITAVVRCNQQTLETLDPLRTSSGSIDAPPNGSTRRSSSTSSSSSSSGHRTRSGTHAAPSYSSGSSSSEVHPASSDSSSSSRSSSGPQDGFSQQQQQQLTGGSLSVVQQMGHLWPAAASGHGPAPLAAAWDTLQQLWARGPWSHLRSSSRAQGVQPDSSWQEVLVGVAEVSFDPSTRSNNGTLEPPQSCAYLCNMAVDPQWRRKGVASYLLAAAEQLSRAAGEQQMYLHLRFQDESTAGALYHRAGFTVARKDWGLVRLLGRDPKYLLCKPLMVPAAEEAASSSGSTTSSNSSTASVGSSSSIAEKKPLRPLPRLLQALQGLQA